MKTLTRLCVIVVIFLGVTNASWAQVQPKPKEGLQLREGYPVVYQTHLLSNNGPDGKPTYMKIVFDDHLFKNGKIATIVADKEVGVSRDQMLVQVGRVLAKIEETVDTFSQKTGHSRRDVMPREIAIYGIWDVKRRASILGVTWVAPGVVFYSRDALEYDEALKVPVILTSLIQGEYSKPNARRKKEK